MNVLVETKSLLRECYHKINKRGNGRDKNLWVLGEWFGKKCCDNTMYFANYIAEYHPEVKLVWVGRLDTDYSRLNKKIKVIEMDNPLSKKILKKAGVAVMNQGYVDFDKKGNYFFDGAITVNLWHGIPWKKINYDINKRGRIARLYRKLFNKIKNAEYYLIPSKEAEEKFKTAFLVNEKKEIKAGYPRNSGFYRKEFVEECRKKIVSMIDVPSNCKIIAYMPTFRDKDNTVFSFKNLISVPENDTNYKNVKRLNKILEDNNAIIVEKSHYISERIKKENEIAIKGRVKSVIDVTASELLASADMLISDYSSCFFDYLILNRPIIHYLYDYNYYVKKDRGVYYSKEDVVCGKVAERIDQLLDCIEKYIENPEEDKELRLKQKEKFWKYDDYDSCEKIYRFIRGLQDKR